jgi:GNAT superfamily N-acetyltransferase
VLAEDDATLVGFACVFPDEHPRYGALLDNLHVLETMKGRGLGSQLLVAAAGWCEQRRSGSGMHLWVYERNLAARRFYERFGARELQRVVTGVPGGGGTVSLRYGWTDVCAVRLSAARTSA